MKLRCKIFGHKVKRKLFGTPRCVRCNTPVPNN